MAKAPTEQRTCPECGFIAKNVNGLRGHRQFKHGVKPASMRQATLEQQTMRLVTEDKLEQLEDKFVTVSEWENTLNDQLEAFDRWRMEIKTLQQQVLELQQQQQRLQAANRETNHIAHNSQSIEDALRFMERDVDLLWSTFNEHIHFLKTDVAIPRTSEFISMDKKVSKRISTAKKRLSG